MSDHIHHKHILFMHNNLIIHVCDECKYVYKQVYKMDDYKVCSKAYKLKRLI